MFAPNRFYTQPQYVDFAALAEARAEEAAAKAAEAEFFAQRARAHAQASLWDSKAPTRHPDRFSWDRPSHAESQPAIAYSPYYEGDFTPCSPYPLGPYTGPRRAHYRTLDRDTIAQLDLERELRRERRARLQLEEELNQLKSREQNRSRLITKSPVQRRGDSNSNIYVFGGHVPQSYDLVGSQPTTKSRPIATHDQRLTPEDVVAEMIMQSIYPNRFGPHGAQHASTPKGRLVCPQHAPKQLPKHQADRGALIDQLKARYGLEGQGGSSGKTQYAHDPLLASVVHQQPTKQPSPSAPNTINHAQGNAPRAATSGDHGLGLVAAILGSLSHLNNQPPVERASPYPAPATARTAPVTLSPDVDIKGKGKEVPMASISNSTFKDVVNALEKVDKIEQAFRSLEAEFSFPANLDFSPSLSTHDETSDVAAIFPHLAYTARNHPVRYYEQTLSSLLQELDLIESHGNSTLRLKRKVTVGAIERALEELEREVAGRWKASAAKEDSKSEQSSPTPASVEAQPTLVSTPTGDAHISVTHEEISSEDFAPSSDRDAPAFASEAQTPSVNERASSEIPVDATPSGVEGSLNVAPAVETTDMAIFSQPEVLAEDPAQLGIDTPPASSPSSPSPPSPKVIAHEAIFRESTPDDDPDAFLLAQPTALEFEERGLDPKKRRSVEIEDLGSEWEDVDEP